MCIGRQLPYVEEGTEIKDGKVTEKDIKCEYCKNPITINVIKKKGGRNKKGRRSRTPGTRRIRKADCLGGKNKKRLPARRERSAGKEQWAPAGKSLVRLVRWTDKSLFLD